MSESDLMNSTVEYSNLRLSNSNVNYTNSSISSRPRTLSFGNSNQRPHLRKSNGILNTLPEESSVNQSGGFETNHYWSKHQYHTQN